MIIRPDGSTRLAITQPDHAALAGRIVHAWRANGLPQSPRRDDILLAVAEHDNGWREVDDTLMVDPATGAILDFVTAPGHIRRGVWSRAIARLATRPYAAALVAHHAQHVYGRYRSDPAWASFFTEMESTREGLVSSLDELNADYLFVRIGDLASLTFCTAAAMPVSEFGYRVRLDGARVIIDPDPFEGARVPISIEGQEIDGYTYARAVTLTGVATGP
jgi:Protein of unknown function (DUF3891)